MPTDAFRPADEQPHVPGGEPWWAETWGFDVWTPDGVAACTCLTVLPNQRRDLVLDGPRPAGPAARAPRRPARCRRLRPGLEVRTDGLWASTPARRPSSSGRWPTRPTPSPSTTRPTRSAAPTASSRRSPSTSSGTPTAAPEATRRRRLRAGGLGRRRHRAGRRALGDRRAPVAAGAPLGRAGRPRRTPAAATLPAGAWVPFPLDGPDGPEVLDRVLGPGGWWERRRPALTRQGGATRRRRRPASGSAGR